MQKLTIVHTPQAPEQAYIRFETNGPQGGNISHGGYARLVINLPAEGSHSAVVDQKKLYPFAPHSEPVHLEINARGDFELVGLIEGLIKLGKALDDEWTPKGKRPSALTVVSE